MRKTLLLSAMVFSIFFASTSAEAFSFGSNKKKQDANNNSQIVSPGQENTNSDNTKKKKSPPASKEEREKAHSYDLVSQSTFWLEELAKNDKDEEAAIEASSALIALNSNQRAAEVAALGIQSHENSPKLWANLGYSFLGLKEYDKSYQALNKASALIPNDAQLKNSIGVSLDELNRPDLAINAYNEGLKISPDNPKILTNLGLSYALNGNLQQAEATLRHAMQSPLAPIQARQNLALVVGLQGRFAESQDIASKDLPPEIAQKNIDYLKQMLGAPDTSNNNSSNNSKYANDTPKAKSKNNSKTSLRSKTE